MNGYAWYLKLQDLVSGPAARLAARYRQSFDRVSQLNRRFSQENRQSGQAVDTLRTKMQRVNGERVKVRVDSSDVDAATQRVGRLRDSLGRFAGGGGAGGGSGGGGRGGGLLGGLLGNVGFGGIARRLTLGALLAGGGALAGNVMDREQLQLQYGLFTRSQAKGNELYGKLNRYADVTPFTNDEILNSGRNLLSMGFSAERVMPLLGKLGNVAAGLKIPFEELTGVFGKMSQKGFADTSDLYQFTDRGVPIMEYLGKVLKKNNAELFKMAEKRQLRFDYIEQAFDRMSAKGGLFEGMLDKMSTTMGGKWSTIVGTATTQITDFGTQFEGSMGKGLDAIMEFQKYTPGVLTSLADLTKGLAGIGAELGKLFSFNKGSSKGFLGALGQVLDMANTFGVKSIQGSLAFINGNKGWQEKMEEIRRTQGDAAANKFFREKVQTGGLQSEAFHQVFDPSLKKYWEKYEPTSQAYKNRQAFEQARKIKQAHDDFIKANLKGQKGGAGSGLAGGSGGGTGNGISKASGLSETVGAAKSQTVNVTIQTLKAADNITLRNDQGITDSDLEAKFQDMLRRLFSGLSRIPAT